MCFNAIASSTAAILADDFFKTVNFQIPLLYKVDMNRLLHNLHEYAPPPHIHTHEFLKLPTENTSVKKFRMQPFDARALIINTFLICYVNFGFQNAISKGVDVHNWKQ